MIRSLAQSIGRSLLYYKKDSVNQIVIVAVLSAIITGSLLTGHSVRASLRENSGQKLGNTSMLISSPLRYFDTSLGERVSERTGEKTAPVLETSGYCQSFTSGITALNINIYGVTEDFWIFHGTDPVELSKGSAAVNTILAERLKISEGDEIIISFKDTDPVPENAPFSPAPEGSNSRVARVERILTPAEMGNFSLVVSQVNQAGIFMNLGDISGSNEISTRANRLLLQNEGGNEPEYFIKALSKVMIPSDIGLTIRRSEKTGEPELISNRIFIDSAVVSEVRKNLSYAVPLITYLGNEFRKGSRSTPYSFITASGYGEIPANGIIINRWMAEDLDAHTGDSLTLTWFDPGFSNRLDEKSRKFVIVEIAENDHHYADPSLMPDFPGISGSVSCSSWDAGVPLLLDRIRDKDEAYWNKYRGTPKAFINYTTGKLLWGNNFGPATALRFPPEEDTDSLIRALSGTIDPLMVGFSVTDVRKKSSEAASGGTDFSSLFLSLSVFMIVSCLILLSMAVSMFFDSRREQVRTFYSLGFRNSSIRNLLLTETVIISAAGSLPGILLGYLFNTMIIFALNSVWRGAVQTDMLKPHIDLLSLIAGFIATIIITSILLIVKSRDFLRSLERRADSGIKLHSRNRNLAILVLSMVAFSITIALSICIPGSSTVLTFTGGVLLFCTMIILLRQYYLRFDISSSQFKTIKGNPVRKFYMFNPGHGLTPAIFIAAGIFAVIVTGANRQEISEKMLQRKGGTGGFLLWAESAVPVPQNMERPEGRREFGLDEEEFRDLVLMQAKRLPGDDASCLNLNHITAPPLLGFDPEEFVSRGSFSFAKKLAKQENVNPWSLLDANPSANSIYGIADQTVLDWGLKLKTGDTLVYRSENGQPINIIICAGLKSSVFQGYLLIGADNFNRYFPSVSGSSIFLAEGSMEMSAFYIETLSQRFSQYGLSVMTAAEKLASFFVVTNTYLDVFMILGILGMIMGVAGLGFVLIRNFNLRKKEFALLAATGFSISQIRNLILKDHIIILFWGIMTGAASGLTSTLQSLRSGYEMPWKLLTVMTGLIIISGLVAVFLSVRSVTAGSLINRLRND